MHCRVVLLRDGARMPTKAHATDSGWDLYSPFGFRVMSGESYLVMMGIKLGLPEGFGAQIRPRSSQNKRGVLVGLGTIDNGYVGEIGVTLFNVGWQPYHVDVGDRIAQLVIERVYPCEMLEVLTLDETDRGTSGFGSSGK